MTGRGAEGTGVPPMDEALRVLARRRITVARLRSHLERRGYSSGEINECLNRLQEWGYLDDRSYARDWVEKVQAEAPMGRARLLWELEARGVPHAVADEVISALLAAVSERDLCEKAARDYLTKPSRRTQGSNRSNPADLARYLLRRGFDDDTVFLVVSELNSDVDLPETVDSLTERATLRVHRELPDP